MSQSGHAVFLREQSIAWPRLGRRRVHGVGGCTCQGRELAHFASASRAGSPALWRRDAGQCHNAVVEAEPKPKPKPPLPLAACIVRSIPICKLHTNVVRASSRRAQPRLGKNKRPRRAKPAPVINTSVSRRLFRCLPTCSNSHRHFFSVSCSTATLVKFFSSLTPPSPFLPRAVRAQ